MGDPPQSDPPKNNPKMGVGSFRSSFVQRTSANPQGATALAEPQGSASDPPKKMVDGHPLRLNQAGQYISIQPKEADK